MDRVKRPTMLEVRRFSWGVPRWVSLDGRTSLVTGFYFNGCGCAFGPSGRVSFQC